MSVTHESAEFLVNGWGPDLVGTTVLRLEATELDGVTFPVLVVYNPRDGREYGYVVSQDEECNGPGWLALL